MDIDDLANLVTGFSVAEIEQGPVSQLDMMNEIQRTQPLSVVMRESVDRHRLWAKDRTVMAN
jgi:hypothetical protein